MIYIKYIFENVVQLGGEVATDQMFDDGWFAYEGPIPKGPHFKLVDGVLENYEPEVSQLRQVAIYQEYLNKTDFKLLPGYDVKEDEDLNDIIAKRKVAREFIRSYQRDVANTTANLL
jgi:hypothetical protein